MVPPVLPATPESSVRPPRTAQTRSGVRRRPRCGSTLRAVSALLALAALLPLAGCKNYLASEEGRTVGEVTDDSAIHARLKAGLVLARGVPGWPIDVDVREGVVVLTGQVATEEQRTRAIGIARGVPGVKDVQDRLVVVGAGEPASEPDPETPAQ